MLKGQNSNSTWTIDKAPLCFRTLLACTWRLTVVQFFGWFDFWLVFSISIYSIYRSWKSHAWWFFEQERRFLIWTMKILETNTISRTFNSDVGLISWEWVLWIETREGVIAVQGRLSQWLHFFWFIDLLSSSQICKN